MLERSADGVLIMSSNSLSRSETSMNLLSAISEANHRSEREANTRHPAGRVLAKKVRSGQKNLVALY